MVIEKYYTKGETNMNYMKEALARCGYEEDTIYEGYVLISNLGIHNEEYYQCFEGYDGMDIDEVIDCIPFENEQCFNDYLEGYTTEIWKSMEQEALDKNGYADYDKINNTVEMIRESMCNDMAEISNKVWNELFKMKEENSTTECVSSIK